jgi:hypothetical protein
MKHTVQWVSLSLLFALGCSREPSRESPAPHASASASVPEDARWLLEGTNDDRFIRVAAHLRGFDAAMVETGHRYGELYWAGRDRNWDYATYQLGKIETAVARGVERRPKRAASARMLEGAVISVREAITARDGAAFDTAFSTLTTTCNACHRAEGVPFIHVAPPAVRSSSCGARKRRHRDGGGQPSIRPMLVGRVARVRFRMARSRLAGSRIDSSSSMPELGAALATSAMIAFAPHSRERQTSATQMVRAPSERWRRYQRDEASNRTRHMSHPRPL